MKKLLPMGVVGLAGLVGAGVLSFTGNAANADSNDDGYTKREEPGTELVVVDDDDDDDTNGATKDRFTRDLSRASVVSRARDMSRNTGLHTRDVSRASRHAGGGPSHDGSRDASRR